MKMLLHWEIAGVMDDALSLLNLREGCDDSALELPVVDEPKAEAMVCEVMDKVTSGGV